MWNLFKLTNLFWLLTSTYIWVTALFNQGPILIVVNLIMFLCISMLPIKIRLDIHTGCVVAAMLLIGLWSLWIDGPIMGLTTILMYLPVLWLLQLPLDYKEDLLKFATKWYAILLIPSLLTYWTTIFINIPSIGMFVHPNYVPFTNYGFFIKTTWDSGFFLRFNAFFLEPGHQALLSTFIMIANRFQFRKCPWLWILLISTLFSFSLAGYLLAATGYVLLKVNTLLKGLVVGALGTLMIVVALNWSGGNNALNDLILTRLEQDSSRGIKGNNRVDHNTDHTFAKAVKNKDLWMGVKDKTNMSLIAGAGFKIYIINYGLVGVILAALFYLCVIPPRPDYRYTVAFFIVIVLCFMQRAYPSWYSWLFPYVMGIYIAKGEKDKRLESQYYNSDETTSDSAYTL
ncbi:MAG: hypothetical protein K2H22_07645 [Muribaculaceae bacterium]|nr:hypothetical protein [Muribaculaceae bacterium]